MLPFAPEDAKISDLINTFQNKESVCDKQIDNTIVVLFNRMTVCCRRKYGNFRTKILQHCRRLLIDS